MASAMLVSGGDASVSTPTNSNSDLSQAIVEEHIALNTVTQDAEISTETVNKDESDTKTVTEVIDAYFADIPIMKKVAWCESRHRQFDSSGNVLRGMVNSDDVGAMQINEQYHSATATKLGYDLHTLEGNLAYGRYLYETQGTKPWVYSKPCWGSSN